MAVLEVLRPSRTAMSGPPHLNVISGSGWLGPCRDDCQRSWMGENLT